MMNSNSMFKVKVTGIEQIQRNLRDLQRGIERNKTIPVSIKTDAQYYIECECPNPECESSVPKVRTH